jgi:hypothetical protein
VAYTAIAPNETKRFRTYESHPWIVREETTAARMMLSGAMAVVGAKKEQEVVITAPPLLNWTVGVDLALVVWHWHLAQSEPPCI